MATVSVSVPDEVKQRMDVRDDVNWSAVARSAFEERLKADEELAAFRKLVSKSKMTEKDVEEISASIKRGMAEKFRKMVGEYKRTGQVRSTSR